MPQNKNTPLRGNKYLLFIMLYQIAISLAVPILENLTGMDFFAGRLSIIPLHILLFILPFIFYLLITSQKISDALPVQKLGFTNIGLIVLMCVTIQPLMMVLSGLSTILFPNNVSDVMGDMYEMPFFIVILATSLTPAITEEITMRGVILSNYENVGIKKAAFINGLLFGILHLDPQQFLYAFLLGFIFAYFVYYTKSIFSSMIAHFTINFVQTALAYLSFSMIEGAEEIIVEQTGSGDLLSAIIAFSVISLIFTPVCIVLFRTFASYNRKRAVTDAFRLTEEALASAGTAEAPEPLPDWPQDLPDDSFGNNWRRIVNWPFIAIIIIFLLFVALIK